MRYNRTQASRSCYAVCAFIVLMGWPLWLKLMTIIPDTEYEGNKPWQPYGDIDFTIWGGNDPNEPGCTSCPGYNSAVRYPVQVELKNFTKLSSASYVILYASLDWKTWWQASVPSILTVVNDPCGDTDDPDLKTSKPFPCGMAGARNQTNGQKMDLCKIPNQLTEGPTNKPTENPTKHPTPQARRSLGEMLAPAAAPVVTGYNYLKNSLRGEAPIPGYVAEEDHEEYLANRRLMEEEKKDARALSADDGIADDLIEEYELGCCIGKPGPTYLVACVIRDWVSFNDNGVKQPGPPFDDRCVAVSGVCGATCGAHTKQPSHCENGEIPLWELVSNLCDDPDTDDDLASIKRQDVDLGKKKKTKKWKDKRCGNSGNDDDTEHYWFDVPLIGHCYWSEVEPAWHWSFMTMMFMSWVSICTASLPGVGVCGSANARLPILHTLNQNHCIDTGVKCIGFSISASEHKLWVLRNLLGKLSASFLHENAVLVDYMQDETCRAGCYAMWDALARFMHVPVGNLEDTIGFCKAWAARLRDPSEILRETEDSFNKHSNKSLKISEVERTVDAFQNIHMIAPKYGISEERIAELHYAYELYELIECLGDRHIWTGWDIDTFDEDESDQAIRRHTFELPGGHGFTAPPKQTAAAYADGSNSEFDLVGGDTGMEGMNPMQGGGDGSAPDGQRVQHVAGMRDWLHHPRMSTFCVQWAQNLRDVAYSKRQKPARLDPFSDQVLSFAKEDPEASKCAEDLHLFTNGGRFKTAYSNYKKTTGQILHDFIDERPITVGAFRGQFHYQDVVMMYSTRAKPEKRDKSNMKKRNLQPGLYACLNRDINLPIYPDNMSRWEAHRACYGKITAILPDRNSDGRRVKFVELTNLSPRMMMHKKFLEDMYSKEEPFDNTWSPWSKKDKKQNTTFLELPLSLLDPLLRCRGKAGGMNYAVKIVQERQEERTRVHGQPAPALTLFAIFDCRHMVTPGFWEQTILHFFREENGIVKLYEGVKYCQVPQNFIGIELATDYLDMQNEYLFRYVNCIRDGVGAVTSCGTNCVWAIEKGFEYEEKTMIEDTATSHAVILQGYEGTYHYEKLIFGTPKENKDFLAAIFRWSRGAVQLFWLAVMAGSRGEGGVAIPFFWIVLFLFIVPMAICQFGMLSLYNEKNSFEMAMYLYCAFFFLFSLGFYFVTTRKYGYLLRYCVLFDNSTYFFNTFPAYYWCLVLPAYMCWAGKIPFDYYFFTLVPGGFLWEVLTYIEIIEVKGWSIVEGRKPEDISILRSQQMYFVNCPLHGLAFYSGCKSAVRILFRHHDASSWSSFGSGGPGDWIVYWLYFLNSWLLSCIVAAFIQVGIYGLADATKVISYAVGSFTAVLFMGLVFDPFCILVYGSTKTITLKHAYLVFWCVMLVLGVVIFAFQGGAQVELDELGSPSDDGDDSRRF